MTDGASAVSREEVKANRWSSLLSESRFLVPGLVLAITFGVYAGTLTYQFVYDDLGVIVNNPLVQSWRFVPRYFTEHVWGYMYPNVPGNYYRPVFLLWLLLNHTLFGIDPSGWHLTAVLAHMAVTLLVYFIARRVTGNQLTALVASLIFGVHPVHIEAVAWVSGVSEPLLAMLLLGSFLSYLRFREGRPKKGKWLAASLLLFALGALAKETSMLFPLMLVAYEWLGGPAPPEPATVEKAGVPQRLSLHTAAAFRALTRVLPFFGVSLAYMVARTLVLRGFGHTVTPLSFATIVCTWPSLLWFYIRMLVWPVGLAAFYDTPYIDHLTLLNFILPLAAVLITAGALLWGAVRSRPVRFALIWLVWPILPLFNLAVFPEGEIAHDRYMYLPSVGFAILVGLGVVWLRTQRPVIAGQPGWVVLAAILIVSLAVGTVIQQRQWRNNLSLYSYGVRIAPDNNLAVNNLGNELLDRGDYDSAIELYRKVLIRRPNFWLANFNIGYAFYKVNVLDEAERYLNRATQINTIDADQYLYLGLTQSKSGRLAEAASSIRRAIEIRPDGRGYHLALGSILRKQGEPEAAIGEFRAELRNNPAQALASQQISEIEVQLRK